jgi:hypothetical protein
MTTRLNSTMMRLRFRSCGAAAGAPNSVENRPSDH